MLMLKTRSTRCSAFHPLPPSGVWHFATPTKFSVSDRGVQYHPSPDGGLPFVTWAVKDASGRFRFWMLIFFPWLGINC